MTSLIPALYFSVFIFSLIVFIEIMIRFKRPFLLKACFLIIAFFVGSSAILNIYRPDLFIYNHLFARVANAMAFIIIFFTLYYRDYLKWALAATFLFLGSIAVNVVININVITDVVLGRSKNLAFDTLDITQPVQLPLAFNFIRFTLVIFYSFIIYLMIIALKRKKNENVYFEELSKWIVAIAVLNFFVVITNVAVLDMGVSLAYRKISFITINFFVLIIIFYRPKFLNSTSLRFTFTGKKSDANTKINVEKFIAAFFNNFYYINKEANLEDCAKILRVDKNDLYRFVYDRYLMSFNDLVNKNRVSYFLELVANRKYYTSSIDDLAKTAGFASRQHLYKPFKKFHGGSPTDLLDARFFAA
jgi:AraC-like DNA-binding protein